MDLQPGSILCYTYVEPIMVEIFQSHQTPPPKKKERKKEELLLSLVHLLRRYPPNNWSARCQYVIGWVSMLAYDMLSQ